MILPRIGAPLVWTELPERHPGAGQIRVAVAALADLRAGRFSGAAVLIP